MNGITLNDTKTKCHTVKVGNKTISGTIDRTCVINKRFSGKILSLNLESSDPYCNVVIYDNNGNKVFDETVIGEEKVKIEFELRGETHVYEMTVSGWWEANNSQVSLLLVSEEFMDENESLFPYTYDKDMEYAGTYFSDITFKSKDNVDQQIDEIIDEFNIQLGKEIVSGAANSVTNPNLDFTVVLAVVIFVLLILVIFLVAFLFI